MQTSIAPKFANDARVIEAEKTLRKCVHCGFCLATCPTYNVLGDELDSPRGRIYLIKQVVEGETPTAQTQLHLDRCLTCRSCETTCPSGAEYGHLLDHGRSLVEEGTWPSQKQNRTMLVLDGCVQPSMAPSTNAAAARVLNALGVQLLNVDRAGCCGAVHFHLNEQEGAKAFMRRNIDAWWPHIDAGAEAIITTASGCGVMVKDYGYALKDDEHYAQKAMRISEMCKDIVEVIQAEDLSSFKARANDMGPIAFHPPCTLQHGQKLPQVTETLLTSLGFNLVPVNDTHICCGSAGTYSLLQPELSQELRDNKIAALTANKPQLIATANVGCQLHLQAGTGNAVVHWIELLDRIL